MISALRAIKLPAEITDAERRHVTRVNRAALAFFGLHLPLFMVIAYLNHTGPLTALLLVSTVLSGPVLAHFTLENPRAVAMVNGVTAMLMGGLLVHFGQGPLQIEMHFYFFALLAMLAAYGNPLVVLIASATVACHHLLLWFLLPKSVFNYDAPVWVVAVHALFVVLESIAVSFIARSFFDSVIGLEKIVAARTAELDRRNDEMRLVLDHVGDGLFTVDASGKMPRERSAILERWFGAVADGETFAGYFARTAPSFAADTEIAWAEIVEGTMPLEITRSQMPKRLVSGERHYDVNYEPIEGEDSGRFLVVVTDVTTDVERAHLEEEKRDTLALLEHTLADRAGVRASVDEASSLVDAVLAADGSDATTLRRDLHTLKATTAFLGVSSVSAMCHELESRLVESGGAPRSDETARILERWMRVSGSVARLLGERADAIELTEKELVALEHALADGASRVELARRVGELRLEPAGRRLGQFAEQARQIAARLDKPGLVVRVVDHGVRLDPHRHAKFWSAAIHAIRNAVDHGIESPDARRLAGKPAPGELLLTSRIEGAELWIEIQDDGRGVDWTAVRARCEEKGIPSDTHEALTAALFRDGLSTANVVSDLSGRGVGMAVLLAATRELGGRIELESKTGRGTTVRAVLPQNAERRSHRPEPRPNHDGAAAA